MRKEGTLVPSFYCIRRYRIVMNLKGIIQAFVEELIQGSELFLVDVRISNSGKRNKIAVLLDSDTGISIDQCAKISREISQKIEAGNFDDMSYVLEVSSPGLDEPLKIKRQYLKNRGRELQVILNDDTQKIGTLEDIKEDSIVLSVSDKKKKEVSSFEFAFRDIKKSNIIVSFK